MNVTFERAIHPGHIFVVDEEGNHVTDLNTMESVEIPPRAHVLSMGGAGDRYEFCLMETQFVFVVDAMDALILETFAEEIT